MDLKRVFTGSKMNKDLDERLLPKGEYAHAENIRVSSSDSADVGAVENVKGNYPLTNFNLTNAVTIGGFADSANQKLYWLTTSEEKDMVVEYDVRNSKTSIVAQSTPKTGILNFDRNYLATGIIKTSNEDFKKDLIGWVDDKNEPRMVNIERMKTLPFDGFVEEDISLIKNPPRYAPKTQLTYTNTSLENNLEDKFLSFATQYKYLDGEYSAISSFSNYCFEPEKFNLDYQSLDNVGMKNMFNAVKVSFDTGSERVTDIRVVFKESNSNTLYIVETFNKKKEMWGNNEMKSTKFSNSKKYVALPEAEIFRTFDNVPLKAKTLSMIGNRIVMGNYEEGRDLVDVSGQEINVSYSVSAVGKNVAGYTIPVSFTTPTKMKIVFGSTPLVEGARINFSLSLKETTYGKGEFNGSYDLILGRDYTGVADLVSDYEFTSFITDTLTGKFKIDYEAIPPSGALSEDVVGFSISSSDATSVTIDAPYIEYLIDDTPSNPTDNPANTHQVTSTWEFRESSDVFVSSISSNTSMKSNRSYEAGIVYLDKNSRSTTVLTTNQNSVYIPQENSIKQNRLIVNIDSLPPVWADRYKVVVKTNKGDYQTIYSNFIYREGMHAWFKLEGSNKQKVREGDNLILKADTGRIYSDIIRLKVLDVVNQPKNFITDNVDANSDEIIEQAGLYMKLKIDGFTVNPEGNKFLKNSGNARSSSSSVYPVCSVDLFTYLDEASVLQDMPVNAGSTVTLKFDSSFNYDSGWSSNKYKRSFLVDKDYLNFQEWFDDIVSGIALLDEHGNDYRSGLEVVRYAGKLYLRVMGHETGGSGGRGGYVDAEVSLSTTTGFFIFETEADDTAGDIFYQTSQTFDIVDGMHKGDLQDQTVSSQAVIELDTFNCYMQGNGAESYRYNDAFNTNYLNIDLRPSLVSLEKYKKVRRYADLTYSEPYNENNNLNGLNEFNLAKANFKDDISKENGYIQKTHSRDTDLLVFQEDKVSKVLFGKSVLTNADGTGNVSSIKDVLGQQVPYSGEYGISRDASTFANDGQYVYFLDSKRGAVMRLAGDGLNEISRLGMKQYFKDKLKKSVYNKKVGGYDPYFDEYLVYISDEEINPIVEMSCSDVHTKEDFLGEYVIEMDLGLQKGECGFSYKNTGAPVKVTIDWGGTVTDYGVIGDPSYNSQLTTLGLPEVSHTQIGSYMFDKTSKTPQKIKITITAPIKGASIEIGGICPIKEVGSVYFIILNQPSFSGTNVVCRYKSTIDGFVGDTKTKNIVLDTNQIASFEKLTGVKGSGYIPDNGATINMEVFENHSPLSPFASGRFLALSTDIEYTEESVKEAIDSALLLSKTMDISGYGDKTYKGDFVAPDGYKNIYLFYDYLTPPVAVDDNYSVLQGETIDVDVTVNDYDPNEQPVNVFIKTQPQYGTVVVNVDNTVTYTNDGSLSTLDSFEYYISNGIGESNVAKVKIEVIHPSSGGGSENIYIVPISSTLDGSTIYELHVENVDFVGYVNVMGNPVQNVRFGQVAVERGITINVSEYSAPNLPLYSSNAVTIPIGVYTCELTVTGTLRNNRLRMSFDAGVRYCTTPNYDDFICGVDGTLIVPFIRETEARVKKR